MLCRVDRTCFIGVGQSQGICHGARGHTLNVDIKTTDIAVQIQKLIRSDGALLKRAQAILHAHIVQRNTAKTSTNFLFVGTPYIGCSKTKLGAHVVDQATAQPARVVHWVIRRSGPIQATAVVCERIGLGEKRVVRQHRVHRQVTVHCTPLHVGQKVGVEVGKLIGIFSFIHAGIAIAKVGIQQVVIGKL